MGIFQIIGEHNENSPEYGTYDLCVNFETIKKFSYKPTDDECYAEIDKWWENGEVTYQVWENHKFIRDEKINPKEITELIIEYTKNYDKQGSFKSWKKNYYLVTNEQKIKVCDADFEVFKYMFKGKYQASKNIVIEYKVGKERKAVNWNYKITTIGDDK